MGDAALETSGGLEPIEEGRGWCETNGEYPAQSPLQIPPDPMSPHIRQGGWPLLCDLQQFEFQESLKLSARAQEGRAPSYVMGMMRNALSAQNLVQE